MSSRFAFALEFAFPPQIWKAVGTRLLFQIVEPLTLFDVRDARIWFNRVIGKKRGSCAALPRASARSEMPINGHDRRRSSGRRRCSGGCRRCGGRGSRACELYTVVSSHAAKTRENNFMLHYILSTNIGKNCLESAISFIIPTRNYGIPANNGKHGV